METSKINVGVSSAFFNPVSFDKTILFNFEKQRKRQLVSDANSQEKLQCGFRRNWQISSAK